MGRPIAEKDLAAAALAGVKWNYLGLALRSACGIAIGIALARLLGPHPFGQFAIAILVVGLGNLMADFGFSAVLIQKKELSAAEIRFLLTAQVGLGAALMLIVAACAGSIARAFGQPASASVVRAMSAMFLIQGFSQTGAALLRRQLAFKRVQIAQVSSVLVASAGIGIPLAAAGVGVWSLVAGQLAQAVLFGILVYAWVRHPVRPRLRWHPGLLKFGAKVVGTNVVNWTITSIDQALVARYFGAGELGLYSRTYQLARTPTDGLVTALQMVLYPVYSRAQEKAQALRRVYLASVDLLVLALLALFAAAALVPETLIVGLLGPRWTAAVPLLAPFALAMPLQGLMAMAGPLLWGVDKVQRELRAQGLVLAGAVLIFFVASQVSIITVAWGLLLVYLLRSLLVTQALLPVLELSWARLLRTVRGAPLLALAVASVVAVSDLSFSRRGMSASMRLIADTFLGGSAGLAVLLIVPALVCSEETLWLMSELRFRVRCLERPLAWVLGRN